jgi:hypothetical protein
VQQALDALVGGLGNAHRVALFQGGMKPEPWSAMPLKDIEFLLLRKFSVQEICRFYRVPPHMVADLLEHRALVARVRAIHAHALLHARRKLDRRAGLPANEGGEVLAGGLLVLRPERPVALPDAQVIFDVLHHGPKLLNGAS